MSTIFLVIVVFLLLLAVFDLFVGVSNDAVNFLQSAVGAKAAGFRTVLVVASVGILLGAMMSAGMMDVARHGVMHPQNFSFMQVVTIFLAVMVTDVIILDVFNTLGLPTSTTVSLVFELLGGTFVTALFMINGNPDVTMGDLMNSDKALQMIIAIFVSVSVAFVSGIAVQWLARLMFTFNYKKYEKFFIAIFGAVSFSCLSYFIFIKGVAESPFIAGNVKTWIADNTAALMGAIFVAAAVLSEVLFLCRVSVFRVVVLMGTFALAMAFAGNDLVNFIGVPLAGLDSFQAWVASGCGDPDRFMMSELQESAKSPFFYLLAAGVVMIVAMVTSKKAQNVVKTSVDLARQDEGDEIFGSSRVARSIVRMTRDGSSFVAAHMPKRMNAWIDSRFNKDDAILQDGAAFDMVRAAINLVLASMLIIFGTTYKLPLSTTYVTFMVAMGSSLADRAWSRESAVFRVTGVISVIGGWFITAGVAFVACALVAALMHWFGFPAMIVFVCLVVFLLVRSNIQYARKMRGEKKDDVFHLMMRTKDPELVWGLLQRHVSKTQSFVTNFATDSFNKILDGLNTENWKELRKVKNDLNNEQDSLKRFRRKEFLAMRKIPKDMALERNTWFHLGSNCNQQFIYCLKRMLEPIKEHVDNNFNPMPTSYRSDFEPVRVRICSLMKATAAMISSNTYDDYDETLEQADRLKDELSVLRKRYIDRMQSNVPNEHYKVALLYLNTLQESQEFLSIMRHQLRAARKFLDDRKKSF